MYTIKIVLASVAVSSIALGALKAQAGSVQRNWGAGVFGVTFGGYAGGAKADQTGPQLKQKGDNAAAVCGGLSCAGGNDAGVGIEDPKPNR